MGAEWKGAGKDDPHISGFQPDANTRRPGVWVHTGPTRDALPVAATRGRNVLPPESRPPRREPEMVRPARGDPVPEARVRHLGYSETSIPNPIWG